MIGLKRFDSGIEESSGRWSLLGKGRGRWFWVDDRDLRTKRAFALRMMLGTLSDSGEREPLPLITIPAQ